MEFSLKAIIVMIILLIAALVFIVMILGWSNESNTWFQTVFGGFKSALGGE
jgi:hypothetical protein